MANLFCPECDGGISSGHRHRLGQRFLCPHCRTVLEVISVRPLELDWADDYEDEESEGSWQAAWSRKLG
jgi:hypothetical protein